jgi:hypothetical protein
MPVTVLPNVKKGQPLFVTLASNRATDAMTEVKF